MKIVLAQANPVVGDIAGNVAKAKRVQVEAQAKGADLVVLPELFVTGYPPEDLVLKPAFARAAREATEALAGETGQGPALLVGTVWPEEGRVYNAVVLIEAGRIAAVRHKVDLPNYGVFDEKRVFNAGALPSPINFRGLRLGAPVCEDIWKEEVSECLAECGAELLLVINGSPFDWTKPDVRMNIAAARVAETGLPLAYLNQVGGQDELVFDGASFVLNPGAKLAVQLPAWEPSLVVTDWVKGPDGWRCEPGEKALIDEGEAAAYHGCMLGLRDYVAKNGFPGVVLGLSGGIDSALVAALSTDALGPERVHCVMMPYRFTSKAALEDAAQCARALGVRYDTVPIHEPVEGFMRALAKTFEGTKPDITEENIQARVRGTTLMAISNKFGGMVVTTGNKSEMSVGYATLYGDMNGGFNPIKDLYKMQVYALARWRNGHLPKGALGPAGRVIPESVLTKAPSAELKENQTDQDTLPPYAVLDDILGCLVEHEVPLADIVARGHAAETVKRVERMLYLAEYKRRQAAPGVKISSRNFGRDRRYPIVNKFREEVTSASPARRPETAAPRVAAPRADGGEVS
jgi:NAD+ synthase